MDGGAWKAAVHEVTKSQTRLSDFTFIFHFHALEKAMATHSSVLAWRIPGTGEPGGVLSMGSHRVGHNWSDLAAAAAAASGGCQHSLAHSRSNRCLHSHTVFSFSICFESPSASLLCGHFFLLHLMLTQIIQGYPPISGVLTIPTKIQHLQIPGIKTWYINIWMAHYNHISTFPLSILFYIICCYKSNRCLLKKIRIYG